MKKIFSLGFCVFFLNSSNTNPLIEKSEPISEKKSFDTKDDFEKIAILEERKRHYKELRDYMNLLNKSFKDASFGKKSFKKRLKKCKKLIKSSLSRKTFNDESFKGDFSFKEGILFDELKCIRENFDIIEGMISEFNDVLKEMQTPIFFDGSQEEFYADREELYKCLREESLKDKSSSDTTESTIEN